MGEPLDSLYGLGYMSQEDLQRTKPCTFDELKDNPEHRYIALHNEFVASALAVIKGHEINSDFMIGNMSSHLTWYPHTCNPKDILACQEKDTMFNSLAVKQEQLIKKLVKNLRNILKINLILI
ncbi:hypothetical protein [Clostridium saccharobutylicum]|uniref:Aryl-phospho-beta-D-glucosidase BglA n=1 Tax=Clostridium saccharobutylicum TaxID=169679 RepID=A0A1S8NHJ5_CLOSA|nr:hypothetical protein [Clostridium saccharobutylicum]OOM15949.1 aryl-phospho-beta-D-glucosidase BglA [Clostridium saccharobutylicum]